jgi:ribosomal protein L37AE/L43A
MNCVLCDSQVFLDEWAGWIWTCINCGHDFPANGEEIEEYEKEQVKAMESIRKQNMS